MPGDGTTVLVVGADGVLGRALASASRAAGATVLETTRRPERSAPEWLVLDLARPVDGLRWPRRIDVAYLLAAVTDLAACERDPEGTGRINAVHTIDLARALVAQGAHVVFPSTNVVFDGTAPHRRADDPLAPPCEYGRQKVRVEAALATLGDAAAVLRLTKVVGPDTGPFASWVERLRRREPIEAFTDKVCAPVSLDDAVRLLRGLGERRLAGVFQASAARDLSYVEVARVLARHVGAREGLVRPVCGESRGVPAALRPAHTTLDASRLAAALGWAPSAPEVALHEGLGT